MCVRASQPGPIRSNTIVQSNCTSESCGKEALPTPSFPHPQIRFYFYHTVVPVRVATSYPINITAYDLRNHQQQSSWFVVHLSSSRVSIGQARRHKRSTSPSTSPQTAYPSSDANSQVSKRYPTKGFSKTKVVVVHHKAYEKATRRR